MSWGVPVPGDDEHVMYVWFDALVNYISTSAGRLKAAISKRTGSKFGNPTQHCGKDNLQIPVSNVAGDALQWPLMCHETRIRSLFNGFTSLLDKGD